MSKFKEGQELLFTPTPVLDEPYPKTERVTYVGITVTELPLVQRKDGLFQTANYCELSLPKKKVPLWEAVTNRLERDYGFLWHRHDDKVRTSGSWINALKDLGIDIPESIEVDDVQGQ